MSAVKTVTSSSASRNPEEGRLMFECTQVRERSGKQRRGGPSGSSGGNNGDLIFMRFCRDCDLDLIDVKNSLPPTDIPIYIKKFYTAPW